MKFSLNNPKTLKKTDLSVVLVNKKALKSKKHEFDIYDNAETINKWCSSNLFEHAKRESFLADLNQTFVSNIFN